MAFIDELNIYIKAGNGGKGSVFFRREKWRPKGGPSGGDGGKGGSVYIEAVRDTSLLSKYKFRKEFIAENGENGGKNSLHGKGGEDLIIKLPVGSVVINIDTGDELELLEDSMKTLLLKGGNGGLGNEHFKSSTNQTPKEFTFGKKGEDGNFKIEIRLIADAGLVGFPNAGKSSLINELTNVHSKVAEYSFTTLSPHLGYLYGYVIADIPGLIEGASSGKGLGHKFLRHIKRTKLIIHCISLENEDIEIAYKTIRKELVSYDKEIADKGEIIVLTKEDLVDKDKRDESIKKLSKYNKQIFCTSIYDDKSIKQLSDTLVQFFTKAKQQQKT